MDLCVRKTLKYVPSVTCILQTPENLIAKIFKTRELSGGDTSAVRGESGSGDLVCYKLTTYIIKYNRNAHYPVILDLVSKASTKCM